MRYPGLIVALGANSLSLPAAPRFHLRGTKGNYWKNGVDPQEAALNKITRIDDPAWGREPSTEWGLLYVGIEGGTVSRPVAPCRATTGSTMRGFGMRCWARPRLRLLAWTAWRVARLLEWAAESSEQRREIVCDWSREPE